MIKDYLYDLAYESGIVEEDNIDESITKLKEWDIINQEDEKILLDNLTYKFIVKTICHLLKHDESLEYLININIFDKGINLNDYVDKDKALVIISKAIDIINNQHFENIFTYELKDENKDINEYELSLDNFGDIFESFKLSGEYEIDLDKADIIFYGNEEETLYQNNNYQLLAAKSKVINNNGFRISYNISKTGISAHLSKKVDKGLNAYFDLSVSNIKPSYNWNFFKNNVDDAYFKIEYHSTEKFGISKAKYKNLYADFKDANKESISAYLTSLIHEKYDRLETSFVLCSIKSPIPNVPGANICIDLLLNIYASGKAEFALSNNSQIGFEKYNGQLRTIKDITRDADFIVRGTTKFTMGLNTSLQTFKLRIMDIEVDAGIKATIQSTIHLFETDETIVSEESYDILDEGLKGQEEIKVCGEVSLRWVLDLKINTAKTLLSKFGLTYHKEFCNEDDQVFGNLHHIENGQFVKKCTRKAKKKKKNTGIEVDTKVNKLSLNRYSIVMKKAEKYEIEVNIPSEYSFDDICYEAINPEVVKLYGNVIEAKTSGSSKIRIYTKDEKYEIFLNVLVSYE